MPTVPQERKQAGGLLQAGTALAAGSAIGVGLSLAVLALTAWLVSCGTLDQDWLGRGEVVASFVGCLVGGCYAIAGIRSRALAVGLGVSAVFCLIWLLAGFLWLNGQWRIAPSGAGAALLGGALSGILSASRKKTRK